MNQYSVRFKKRKLFGSLIRKEKLKSTIFRCKRMVKTPKIVSATFIQTHPVKAKTLKRQFFTIESNKLCFGGKIRQPLEPLPFILLDDGGQWVFGRNCTPLPSEKDPLGLPPMIRMMDGVHWNGYKMEKLRPLYHQ